MFGSKTKMVASRSGIKIIPKTKRESFLPSDKEWLDNNRVSPAKFIGKGAFGAVYSVKDNDNLVVKIPVEIHEGKCRTRDGRCFNREEMVEEAKKCNTLNNSFGIPTKLIKVCKCDRVKNGHCLGLVRPKLHELRPIYKSDGTAIRPMVSEEALESLRQKLIKISEQGYYLQDGLQIGVDRKGNIYQFDLGCLVKAEYIEEAFNSNNIDWYDFLRYIGKLRTEYKPISRRYR
jgi:hypothetical protein